jgi:FlaA1/EpsC-like NDP-sugar epimerase
VTDSWNGLAVLITGVCGTVGRELLRQIVARKPAELLGLDNNETDIFFLAEEYRDNHDVRLFLGDVRDRDRLLRATEGINVILHAAALKHVIP